MASASKLTACPRVWGLIGAHAGDNRQVLFLLAALGLPYEVKALEFNGLYAVPNWLLGATGASLRAQASTPLESPWPDLVVAAGRRTVPIARWIKAQSKGRSKLVQIGRPRAPLGLFDLVITTPQYGLPQASNIIHNTLPLQAAPQIEAERIDHWNQIFAALPPPWIALLVGGQAWPFRLDAKIAAKLGGALSAEAQACGGSLLVATSPRTGALVTDALFQAVSAPAHLCDWRSAPADCYPSILKLADRIVVTSDSVSMLSEACRTEKPVEIYPLPGRKDPLTCCAKMVGSSALFQTLARIGLSTPPRDVARIAERLYARGGAKPFGRGGKDANLDSAELSGEVMRTVEQVLTLLDGRAAEQDR